MLNLNGMKHRMFQIENCREAGRAEWNAIRSAALRDGKEIPEGGKLELVENKATGQKELQIRGYVWHDMSEELDRILEEFEPKTLVVRINSGGGSAFTGFEIANRLRGIDAHVITRNESAAMSAAAVIFLAGDEREVGSMGTSTMFHDARGFIDILEFGPVEKLEQVDVQSVKDKELDLLRSLNKSIRAMLLKVSEMDEDEITTILSAEKQLTSEEALEFGIATGTYEKPKAAKKDKKAEAEEEKTDEKAAGGTASTDLEADSKAKEAVDPDPEAVEEKAEETAADPEQGTLDVGDVELREESEPSTESDAKEEQPAKNSADNADPQSGGGALYALLGSANEEVLQCS